MEQAQPALTERHFSIRELAESWGLSPAAIRRLFRNEPGVIRFGKENKGHRRDYVTLRVPASVAERVYRRCMCPGIIPHLDHDKRKAGA